MITIYKTKHCPWCLHVKRLFDSKNIEYTEVQLEDNPDKQQELWNLGYRTTPITYNSKDFGVPQNRERIYFVGHLRGECSGEVFPITGTNRQDIVQVNHPKHSNDRIYSEEGISPTLNTMQGGNRQPFITNPKMNNYKPDYNKSVAITASSYKEPPVVSNIRRLTPKECERLQGFPDDWTKYGINDEPISDTQRYKMCGNAVTVNVVQAVMEKLYGK